MSQEYTISEEGKRKPPYNVHFLEKSWEPCLWFLLSSRSIMLRIYIYIYGYFCMAMYVYLCISLCIFIYMYVCLFVCIYVHMYGYVCIYACKDACLYAWFLAWSIDSNSQHIFFDAFSLIDCQSSFFKSSCHQRLCLYCKHSLNWRTC